MTGTSTNPLEEAVELLRARRHGEARPILVEFIRHNPNSERAWYLLSYAVPDLDQQIDCLQRVLRLNPANSKAQQRLAKLTSGEVEPSEAAEEAPTRLMIKGYPLWLAATVIGFALLCVVGGGWSAFSGVRGYLERREATRLAALPTATGLFPTLPPTWTPSPGSFATRTPRATATPTVAPTATQAPPDPETLAEMDEIQLEVADLRGLPAQAAVSRFVIPHASVQGKLTELYFQFGSEAQLEDQALVLSALGLIKPTYNLLNNALNSLSDGVGGFYVSWSKELFVIGDQFRGIERFVYSHEYNHALVDHHFAFGDMGVYPQCDGNKDRCSAIRALIEGDATLLMYQWWEQYAGPEDYAAIAEYEPPQQTLPEDFPPPYVSQNADFPYEHGLRFVSYLYERGNWAEVNRAYQKLPESTEQILHPERYVADERPIPIAPEPIGRVLGGSWRLLESSTLGEWMTFLILGYGADLAAQLDAVTAEVAANGWGGDSYQVLYNDSTGETVLAIHWVWDTPEDAFEFTQAMLRYQDARFRSATLEHPSGDCWEANLQTSCMFSSGREVLWLLAPNLAMIDSIVALFPDFS